MNEDQKQEADEPEFYAPWGITKRLYKGPIAEMAYVVYDDNGNTMAYAEDDFFLAEAVQRINAHDGLVAALEHITHIAGNMSDEAIQRVGGVNDARRWALAIVQARQIAADALAKTRQS